MESDDEVMQQPFSINTPAKIKGDDGKEYKNPAKDLHLITATACEPKYFQSEPKWKWDSIARDPNANPYIKGDLRGLAKSVEFAA